MEFLFDFELAGIWSPNVYMSGFSNQYFSPTRYLGQQTENTQRVQRLSMCFSQRTKDVEYAGRDRLG